MHNSARTFLSIVIPAYNEEARVVASLEKIADYLGRQKYTSEVLVADDGSTDRTKNLCDDLAKQYGWLRVLHYSPNHGKGFAVRTGVMEAAGDHILICDADLSTPIEELDGFWRYIKEGYDIVIASRPLRESHLVKHQPFHREFAGRTFNFLVRAIAVRGIHDTQCGFKLFCRDAAEAIFPRCSLDGFSFDIEVLHIAQRLGYTIKEAPVHWYHRPGSKVSLLRDGPRMLTDLIKLRLRRHDLRKQTCDETR